MKTQLQRNQEASKRTKGEISTQAQRHAEHLAKVKANTPNPHDKERRSVKSTASGK